MIDDYCSGFRIDRLDILCAVDTPAGDRAYIGRLYPDRCPTPQFLCDCDDMYDDCDYYDYYDYDKGSSFSDEWDASADTDANDFWIVGVNHRDPSAGDEDFCDFHCSALAAWIEFDTILSETSKTK